MITTSREELLLLISLCDWVCKKEFSACSQMQLIHLGERGDGEVIFRLVPAFCSLFLRAMCVCQDVG